MTLTSPWWHWALAFAGAFIAGMSKTGIPGLGILAVPLFAKEEKIRLKGK